MAAKRAMKAGEYLESTKDDERIQSVLREKEPQRVEREKELKEDERELIAECNAAGVQISSVWDLVYVRGGYRQAVPILIKHLDEPHDPWTQQGIVRALITPEAKGLAAMPLIKLFQEINDPDSELKWLAGAAIAETSTGTEASQILDLINDEENGPAREWLPLGLIHMTKSEALAILVPLSSHPTMGEASKKAIEMLNLTA